MKQPLDDREDEGDDDQEDDHESTEDSESARAFHKQSFFEPPIDNYHYIYQNADQNFAV